MKRHARPRKVEATQAWLWRHYYQTMGHATRITNALFNRVSCARWRTKRIRMKTLRTRILHVR